MNNPRRKKLAKLQEQIEEIRMALEEILEEEQEAYDNMPENLQYSERGEKAEECISALEDAVSNLEEVVENIDTAIEQRGANNMIVTFQDELGCLELKIDTKYGVTFGANKVFFTDEDGNDYKINVEHLISISAE